MEGDFRRRYCYTSTNSTNCTVQRKRLKPRERTVRERKTRPRLICVSFVHAQLLARTNVWSDDVFFESVVRFENAGVLLNTSV